MPSTLDRRPQLLLAFPRFPTTAGQSLSVAVRILPRYLNSVTLSISVPYASNARSEFSLVSVSSSRRLFLSTPLRHCAVPGCRPFSALRGDLHVAPGAPWVRGVSFLHHHHSVEDMPVHEVHPHCRSRRHSPRSTFHGACPRSPLFTERASGIPGGAFLHPGWSTVAVAPPPSHVESSDDSIGSRLPASLCTLCTSPGPLVGPCMTDHLP